MTHYYWTRLEDHPVAGGGRLGQVSAPSAPPQIAKVPPLPEHWPYHRREGSWRERLSCNDTALPITYFLLTRDVFHTDL